MNACELTLVINAIAELLASNLSADSLSLLSAVLIQLVDTLDTIVTFNEVCIKAPIEEKSNNMISEECKNVD